MLTEEETKLADYLLQTSEMGYGLTREGVMVRHIRLSRKVNILIHFRMEVLEGPGSKAS